MSILAEPLFLLSAAVFLAAVLAPVLLRSRKNFSYAMIYDTFLENAVESEGKS